MTFSFIQITDHHLGETEQDTPFGYPAAATLRAVIEHIAHRSAGQADFLISTGDLVNRPNPASYDFLRKLLALSPAENPPGPHTTRYDGLIDLPIYLLPGNHDQRAEFFSNLFMNGSKAEYLHTSFVHKGIRFVIVDWGTGGKAEFTPGLLEGLNAALTHAEPAVFLMHHNVAPLGASWLDWYIADGIDEFCKVLHGKRVLAIFCGHLHTTYETSLHGIPVFGLRSTAFQFLYKDRLMLALRPPHYRLITIHDGTHLTTQVVEVPLPMDLVETYPNHKAS